jgi:rhamnose utilization protein RhaD (predicted bifunctional aldolase and dehydrogenase)
MSIPLAQKLANYSARWGSDPLLTQGAGGNTSLKDGRTLLIKASGKRLQEALSENIFIEMDQPSLYAAIQKHTEIDFNAGIQGPLRGSIETPLHAVIPHAVVVHVHSVRTLSYAARTDGPQLLAQLLHGVPWAWVPYAKPGWPLTWELEKTLSTSPLVWVLQNHGLIVAEHSLEAAHALLCAVEERLDSVPRPTESSPSSELQAWILGQHTHRLAASNAGNALAFCEDLIEQFAKGVICPDQAVFLGREITLVHSISDIATSSSSVATVVKGHGVVIKTSAGQGADDLLCCLGLLASRVSPSAHFSYLSPPQVDELLTWDAEKYRQAIDINR